MNTVKVFTKPEQIREAMPRGYSSVLPEITPFHFNAISRAIENMDTKHRSWPVIMAMATEGEIAAREVAAKLGWLKQAA